MQCGILLGPGVSGERIHLDHGLTGTDRDRPGLARALAAVRFGGTVVTGATVHRVLERHRTSVAPSFSGGP
ncbi:hypothetical protein ABZZ47_39320 [Streptomyces sp. NPDC006465]|uniref:hypothetical protein n=1 Tax=Streptomyces sp. NPDC006465 TaxID=3157174 RepID=UPI0033BE40B1